jgi:hypothetical protein
MSLRRVDPRFCLPEPPRTAVVLGGVRGWAQGLAEAGVEVRTSGPVDLVVAPASAASEALATGAAAVVLEGRGGRRRLMRAGRQARALLVRPRSDRPELLVPLDQRRAAAYAIAHWSAGYSRRKAARNRLARTLVSHALMPEVDPVVAVGHSAGPPVLPYIAQAAEPLGVPADARWFMTCGHGDALSRNVLHLFRRDAEEPAWVLKFARLPGHDEQFRRDELGLGLAQGSGHVVAGRAPRLLGRFRVEGLEASLETAASGRSLRAALVAPGSARSKLSAIEEVAEWLLAVARETATRSDALRPELDRLLANVVPAWSEYGVTADLVRSLPALPAVLQHNDVGCWNVVLGRSGFTVVDWESAREHGLPLWDLVYFLTDALATLDRAATPHDQDEYSRRLLAGVSPRSSLLFRWVERAARDLDVPRASVGPIVTLGLLHHGLSHGARVEALSRVGGGDPGSPGPAGRLAPMWLRDPALGVEWKAWRAL